MGRSAQSHSLGGPSLPTRSQECPPPPRSCRRSASRSRQEANARDGRGNHDVPVVAHPARRTAGLGVVRDVRLILTCGLPGAGKTALARQLAADRSAVRLTKDEWLWALGSTPWDAPTQEKVEHELWQLAQEILSLGLSVVLDFGLWARIERDGLRSVARGLGVGVELHYLDVPVDELWRRIDARNSQPPWDSHPIRRVDLDGWLQLFQAPEADELALFDCPPGST
jgi:predicted kinase